MPTLREQVEAVIEDNRESPARAALEVCRLFEEKLGLGRFGWWEADPEVLEPGDGSLAADFADCEQGKDRVLTTQEWQQLERLAVGLSAIWRELFQLSPEQRTTEAWRRAAPPGFLEFLQNLE